jgi:hypothetical protein
MVLPIRHPTLFQMEKLEGSGKPATELKLERPFSPLEILLNQDE